jgi:SAM-dependent methyltransferase
MTIFWEIHQDNPREGPGDNASTRRAFEMISALPKKPKILDIGCGPGMQTIELAQISQGDITAVDNYQPFLDELNRRAKEAGVAERINTHNQSLFYLDLPPNSFDLIWSEGAMYLIGLQTGLEEWQEFLKPQGYMAFTEIAWLKPDPPKEIRDFWSLNYPGMRSMEENSRIIQNAGFFEVGSFVLPESAWWDSYYNSILKRVSILRAKYAGIPEPLQELDAQQHEIAMYRKYHDYYGYVFYIVWKTV